MFSTALNFLIPFLIFLSLPSLTPFVADHHQQHRLLLLRVAAAKTGVAAASDLLLRLYTSQFLIKYSKFDLNILFDLN